MSHERFEQALPWYVGGGLDAAEAASMETHLASCAACRDALQEIRSIARAAAIAGTGDELLDHPPASMLWDHATNATSVAPGAAAWLREHLSQCEACASTQSPLKALARQGMGEDRSPRGASLTSIARRALPVLVPLAAVLILVSTVVLLRGRPGSAEPVTILAPALPVSGEIALRSPGGGETPPLPVPLPPAGPLHLDLRTEVDPLLLEDTGVSLRLEIRQGSAILASRRLNAPDFDARGDVRLLLDRSLVTAGATLQVDLRMEAPGEDLDGRSLFRRRLVIHEAGSKPAAGP